MMIDRVCAPVPLTPWRSVVIVSDWIDGAPGGGSHDPACRHDPPWDGVDAAPVEVAGGYLERLPLALVASGIADRAEIWHYWRSDGPPPFARENPVLARRGFRIEDETAPYRSADMIDFVRTFGAPHILIVLGLGVAAELLDLCANSMILYNSIDAPALRVPPQVSQRFDLVITGAQWQSDVVTRRHPGMATIMLPIGPEFAAIDQFRPLGTPKDVDLIYVAAAQPYKRHDILFDALDRLPRDIRALCVFGYGEMGDDLRRRAAERRLSVEFVGPPGVPIDQVNRLMNRAKFGVVCGVDDGAPAILTEYMLAGLPVLANAQLSCGLQFILPETGIVAPADRFADAILSLRDTAATFAPRQVAIDRWSWPHGVARLAPIISALHDSKQRQASTSTIALSHRGQPPSYRDRTKVHGTQTPPAVAVNDDGAAPIICFSHLRWDFVTQRPQHLMRRFARRQPVFVWEEHIPCDHPLPFLEHHPFAADGVIALRPRLPHWWTPDQVRAGLRELLDMLVRTSIQTPPLLWFYTPAMFGFADHLDAAAVIYDCMDELSAFRFADPALLDQETRLLARADLVFTGGYSLYEAKRDRHPDVHPFPSAVDVAHFAQARGDIADPEDQRAIAGPRLGFFGVIDERIDLSLIDAVAAARPDWSLVMIGPVVKIDPADLPRRANIHWMGARDYSVLPAYLSGWDAALMPFAINAATRFISPTKTPEYLAGGLPVVSTPIVDVVRHYGGMDAVAIADDAQGFVAACERALALPRAGEWRDAADRLLASQSWDKTQRAMADAIARVRRGERPAPQPRERYDTLVVGAGFAGAVLAERLAADAGQRVLVIDRRPHIGGNAFDEHDAAGVLIHRYGPHIFHTNSAEVFDYLSRFTDWRPYEHRVLASVNDALVPIPINRTTLNALYGLSLDSDEAAAAFLADRAQPVADIRTSEDVVVSAVGQELYETFFRGYTRKQWGLDPSQLDRAVTARVPTRTSTDDRYFADRFQAMPAAGYTRMFEAMLDHPGITVRTGTEYRDILSQVDVDHIVFTGPIDEFFDFRFGKLPYRSLEFRHETHDVAQYQPVGVVNYPDEAVPHTRITEYKHLTGQQHPRTSITFEIPSAQGDPYYPIPRPENQALFKRYEALADAQQGVTFVGRLATYRYYNMDQVVGQALATYRRMRQKAVVQPQPSALTAAE